MSPERRDAAIIRLRMSEEVLSSVHTNKHLIRGGQHRAANTQRHRDTEGQRHRDTETQRHRGRRSWCEVAAEAGVTWTSVHKQSLHTSVHSSINSLVHLVPFTKCPQLLQTVADCPSESWLRTWFSRSGLNPAGKTPADRILVFFY